MYMTMDAERRKEGYKGGNDNSEITTNQKSNKLYKLMNGSKLNWKWTHQSLYHKERGKYCWEKCPDIAMSKSRDVNRK